MGDVFVQDGLCQWNVLFLWGNLEKCYSGTTIEDDYRKYKNTGDILLMNPNVKIFEDLDKISFPYY